ncbi:hypothetical protein [Salimicrobium flavidum]|nr:hypothetical protein [Salimicrobium flavidum]
MELAWRKITCIDQREIREVSAMSAANFYLKRRISTTNDNRAN